MRILFNFKEFITESVSGEYKSVTTYSYYDLRQDILYNEDIVEKIDEIESDANSLIENYKWGLHGGIEGFEFNIKPRKHPDMELIRKKYEISDEYVYELWNQFLSESLRTYMEGYLENHPGIIKKFHQTGRSGGWIKIIPYDAVGREDLENNINDEIESVKDSQKYLSDDDISDLNFLYQSKNSEKRKKAIGILRTLGGIEISGDSEYYLKEKDKALENLELTHNDVSKISGFLKKVDDDIENFWNNSHNTFLSWVDDELIYMGD